MRNTFSILNGSFKSSKTLVIDKDSEFIGDISCVNIEIHGKLQGTILSTGTVTFFPCAQFSGTIKAQDIKIYPGAEIEMKPSKADHLNE